MHRGAGIVLVAPGPVPDAGNRRRGNEDDGGVVDGLGGDGDDSRHTEERQSEQGPGYLKTGE